MMTALLMLICTLLNVAFMAAALKLRHEAIRRQRDVEKHGEEVLQHLRNATKHRLCGVQLSDQQWAWFREHRECYERLIETGSIATQADAEHALVACRQILLELQLRDLDIELAQGDGLA